MPMMGLWLWPRSAHDTLGVVDVWYVDQWIVDHLSVTFILVSDGSSLLSPIRITTEPASLDSP